MVVKVKFLKGVPCSRTLGADDDMKIEDGRLRLHRTSEELWPRGLGEREQDVSLFAISN